MAATGKKVAPVVPVVPVKKVTAPTGKAAPKVISPPLKDSSPAPGSPREGSKVAENASAPKESDKKIVNRNQYEAVGPDSEASARTTTKPVMRNFYEAVGGDDDAVSQKPKMGGGGALLPDDQQNVGPTEVPNADETSTKSEIERREKRRRRLQEEVDLMGRKRMVIVGGILVIVFLLIIAAIVGGVIFLSRKDEKGSRVRPDPMKKSTPAPLGAVDIVTYGTAECYFQISFGRWMEAKYACVSVKPIKQLATNSCQVACYVHRFLLFSKAHGANFERFSADDPPISRLFKPQDHTSAADKIGSMKPLFCLDQYDRQDMICVDGQCGYEYNGTNKPFDAHEKKGKWADGCDKWSCNDAVGAETETLVLHSSAIFNRDICNQTSLSLCKTGMAAVVYAQRRECEMNEDNVGEFCKFASATPKDRDSGVVQLFKCADCPQTVAVDHEKLLQQACTDKGYTYVQPKEDEEYHCFSECLKAGESVRVMLPDGAACHEFGNEPGYCVGGTCFWWNRDNTPDKIENITMCKEKQDKRGNRPTRFR